jgi:hypothetical protein
MKRKVSLAEMVAEVRWALALNHYRHYADKSRIRALQAEGVKSERGRAYLQHGVKRKRGQPPALHLPAETVVQLVFKQELQGGVPFTNWPSREANPCIVAVAHARGVSESTVARMYKSVPTHRRKQIRDGLHKLLREHGALHPRHQGR